jgi:predicted ATPase
MNQGYLITCRWITLKNSCKYKSEGKRKKIAMIKELRISNFRCYNNVTIVFKDISILVGKNNSGKSTLIEALRISAVVTNRYKNLQYQTSPSWLKLETDSYGVSPSIENLDISRQNIFYYYGDPPSKIEVIFNNKTRIETYVGEDASIFSIIFDQNNTEIKNKSQAKIVEIPVINILPQISPLRREEKIVKFQTVQSNLLTKLSSRNFRNQIKYFNDDFPKFRDLAEKTWKGLTIDNIKNVSGFMDEPLQLMVRDNGFTAEIGWMGHGLQMWLQTMWFIARSVKQSIVILDEPDVYMHADLQRRLIRLITSQFQQLIIATHSVEIMAEVESENILPIDSNKRRLTHARSLPFVQKLIDDIGSIHNIEIARIFTSKKFLIVEGDKDDVKILSLLQGILFPETHEPFDTIPKTFVEGWGGWQRVIGAKNVFQDINLEIRVYCIFDSDYHTQEEKDERKNDAETHSLNLHIWSKKEIENFLLLPEVIFRTINKSKRKGTLSVEIIENKLDEIAEKYKSELYLDFATEIQNRNRQLALKSASNEAAIYLDPIWDKNKLSLLPGKKIISELSSWSQEQYNANLNSFKIARNINKNEISIEVKHLIEKIERNELLTPYKSVHT